MSDKQLYIYWGDCPAWAGHRAITASENYLNSLRNASGDHSFYRYPGHSTPKIQFIQL
jgi:hypothetical protein